MRISIVVPTHNRKALLYRCLAAVTNQSYDDYEAIVVDDGSTDGTAEMVEQEFPQVCYLRQALNRGPAAARNRGIEAATGDIVAFTDDDCVVPADWLSKLRDGFLDHPQVAGVGGYQGPPTALVETNIIARSENRRRLQRWGPRAASEQMGFDVPGLATNNVAYRKSVLLEVNGFDERFPVAAGEDADLKLRLTQLGYSLLYLPLKVTHHRTYTWGAQWRMSFRRGIGVYYFEAKHATAPGKARVLLRLCKRLLWFFVYLVRISLMGAITVTMSEVADALGQWSAIRKMSRKGKLS